MKKSGPKGPRKIKGDVLDALLDEFERQGFDPRESSLKIGIFGAEPWTEAMRAEIEDRLDMHAVDIYGLS